MANIGNDIISKTKEHIVTLYEEYSTRDFFGRLDVECVTGLKLARASELKKLMLENNIIDSVTGHGKGKYCF